MKSNRLFIGAIAALVLGVGLLMYANHNGWFEPSAQTRTEPEEPETTKVETGPPHPDWKKVGGVWRPPSDTQATNKPNGKPERTKAPLPNPGMSKPISQDTSPQTDSIAQALKGKENMDRISPFFATKDFGGEFDRDAFLKDPSAYLAEHNVRRAFEPAKEAEGIKPIKRLSPYYQKIVQGETVVLRAQGEPNMPVSFYAPMLGIFEGSQTSAVTVQADKEGVAEARYTPTGGTHGDTPIVAASPVNTRQTRFLVHVVLPNRSGE